MNFPDTQILTAKKINKKKLPSYLESLIKYNLKP